MIWWHMWMSSVAVLLAISGLASGRASNGGGSTNVVYNYRAKRYGSYYTNKYWSFSGGVGYARYSRVYKTSPNLYPRLYNYMFDWFSTNSYKVYKSTPHGSISVCKNYEADENGTYLGIFTCPLPFVPEDHAYCCGVTNAQYCCKFWDVPLNYMAAVLTMLMVALLFITAIHITIQFCLNRYKKVQAKKKMKYGWRFHDEDEYTEYELSTEVTSADDISRDVYDNCYYNNTLDDVDDVNGVPTVTDGRNAKLENGYTVKAPCVDVDNHVIADDDEEEYRKPICVSEEKRRDDVKMTSDRARYLDDFDRVSSIRHDSVDEKAMCLTTKHARNDENGPSSIRHSSMDDRSANHNTDAMPSMDENGKTTGAIKNSLEQDIENESKWSKAQSLLHSVIVVSGNVKDRYKPGHSSTEYMGSQGVNAYSPNTRRLSSTSNNGVCSGVTDNGRYKEQRPTHLSTEYNTSKHYQSGVNAYSPYDGRHLTVPQNDDGFTDVSEIEDEYEPSSWRNQSFHQALSRTNSRTSFDQSVSRANSRTSFDQSVNRTNIRTSFDQSVSRANSRTSFDQSANRANSRTSFDQSANRANSRTSYDQVFHQSVNRSNSRTSYDAEDVKHSLVNLSSVKTLLPATGTKLKCLPLTGAKVKNLPVTGTKLKSLPSFEKQVSLENGKNSKKYMITPVAMAATAATTSHSPRLTNGITVSSLETIRQLRAKSKVNFNYLNGFH